MDAYQEQLFETFAPFRQEARYPTYPPYHKGLYLEEYFCDKIASEQPHLNKYFIPVHWTNCYNDGYSHDALQHQLYLLDPTKEYFCVMTHDDAPRERLPRQTISLSGGGLAGQVPIPLIGSGFPTTTSRERDIFCSFVGSNTHPLRAQMAETLHNKDGFYMRMKGWQKTINKDEETHFKEIMERSVFSLCPRGYGPTSFRLYEALQVGSIPVYVFDKCWLPYEHSLDWNSFAVLVPAHRIFEIEHTLKAISPETIGEMSAKGMSLYQKWFTIGGVYERVVEKLRATQ